MLIVNMGSRMYCNELGAKGICTSVITACASATHAIGDAFRHIRDGYAEIVCTGGSEASVTPLELVALLNESTDLNVIIQNVLPFRLIRNVPDLLWVKEAAL